MSQKSGQPFVLKFKGNKAFSPFSNIVDEEGLKRFWGVCTKVSKHLEQGERLENLSWRLWHLHSSMIDQAHEGVEERKRRKEFKLLTRSIGNAFDKEKGMQLEDLSVPDLPPFRGILSEDALLERAAVPKSRTSSRSKGAAGKMASMIGSFELDPTAGSSTRRTSKRVSAKASSTGKKPTQSGRRTGSGDASRGGSVDQQQFANDVEMGESSSSNPAGPSHTSASPFSISSFNPSPNSTTPATTPPAAKPQILPLSSSTSLRHFEPPRSIPSSSLNSTSTFKQPVRPPNHRAASSSVPSTILESGLIANALPSGTQPMQQFTQYQYLQNSNPSSQPLSNTHDYSALYKILPQSALQHLRPPPTASPSTDPAASPFFQTASFPNYPNPPLQTNNAFPSNSSIPSNSTADPIPDASFEEFLKQLDTTTLPQSNTPQQGSAGPSNHNNSSALDFSSWGVDSLGGNAGAGAGVGVGSTDLSDFFTFDNNNSNPSNLNPSFPSNQQPMSGVESHLNTVQTPHTMSSATAPSPFGSSSTASLSPPSDNSKRWAGVSGTSPPQGTLPHPRVRRLSKMQERFAGKGGGKGGFEGDLVGSAIASESENEDAGSRERASRSRVSSMPSTHHPYRNESRSPSRARNRPTLKIPEASELGHGQLSALASNPLLQRQASFTNSPLRRTASPSSMTRQPSSQSNSSPNPASYAHLSAGSFGTPTSELANTLGGMGVNSNDLQHQQHLMNSNNGVSSMLIPSQNQLDLASNLALYPALLNLSNFATSPSFINSGSTPPFLSGQQQPQQSNRQQQQQQQPMHNQVQLERLQQLAQLQQNQASLQHFNQSQLQYQLVQLQQMQAAQAASATSSSSSNHTSPSTFSPSSQGLVNPNGGSSSGSKKQSSSSRRASESTSSRPHTTSLRNQIRQQSYNSQLSNQTHSQPQLQSSHSQSSYAHDLASAAALNFGGPNPQQQQQQQVPVRLSLEEQLRLAGMWNDQQQRPSSSSSMGGAGGSRGGMGSAGGNAMQNSYASLPGGGYSMAGGAGGGSQTQSIDFSGMMGMSTEMMMGSSGTGPMLGGDGGGNNDGVRGGISGNMLSGGGGWS